jgi:CHRD domain
MKLVDHTFIVKTFFMILSLLTFNSALGAVDNRFSAPLTGMEEVPPVTTNSTGISILELINNNTINYKLNVTNLDNIKAAHIHLGNFSQNGDVVATLFNSSKTPTDMINGTLVEGKITAANLQGPLKEKTISDLVQLMNTTQTYVNIHTVEYPNGEIRGQLITVNATNWWGI